MFILKKAFTLSEVLITLTIIGVVAAITVPLIQKDALTESYLVKAKKVYDNLQGSILYSAIEGTATLSSFTDQDNTAINKIYSIYIEPHVSVARKCDSNQSNCWTTPKLLNGNSFNGANKNYITALLSDGTSINVDVWDSTDTYNKFGVSGASSNTLIIMYDVNGPKKGPNTFGKDVFATVFDGDELIPACKNSSTGNCDKTNGGMQKLKEIIEEDNIEGSDN